MAWRIEFIRSASKDLSRIDRTWQRRILDFLQTEVAPLEDPRSRGKALSGPLAGYWRYRVGDYRVICEIEDDQVRVLVVWVAHRSRVYD